MPKAKMIWNKKSEKSKNVYKKVEIFLETAREVRQT